MYWFFNYRIADHIYPKDDQVYVQLWHGTPLKRLGYDISISDNAMNSKEEIRQKYKVDAEKFKYILAPSCLCGGEVHFRLEFAGGGQGEHGAGGGLSAQ